MPILKKIGVNLGLMVVFCDLFRQDPPTHRPFHPSIDPSVHPSIHPSASLKLDMSRPEISSCLMPIPLYQTSQMRTGLKLTINESWENWKRVFLHIFDKHAPKRVIRVRNKPTPWLDSNLKQQMMTRNSLKRRAIKTGSENDWNCYRNMRNKVNYAVKCAKSNYYRKKLHGNLGNPCRFR